VNGFVLDASVTMSWCFPSQANPYSQEVLEALDGTRAIAPEVWLLEVANSLVISERKRRLLRAQSDEFLETLRLLPIDVESVAETPPWIREVILIARSNGLSSYDAAYLELAKRRNLPLATRDSALGRAAVRSGVPLFLDSTV
jgi:predicted nucleic acid-binding protein